MLAADLLVLFSIVLRRVSKCLHITDYDDGRCDPQTYCKGVSRRSTPVQQEEQRVQHDQEKNGDTPSISRNCSSIPSPTSRMILPSQAEEQSHSQDTRSRCVVNARHADSPPEIEQFFRKTRPMKKNATRSKAQRPIPCSDSIRLDAKRRLRPPQPEDKSEQRSRCDASTAFLSRESEVLSDFLKNKTWNLPPRRRQGRKGDRQKVDESPTQSGVVIRPAPTSRVIEENSRRVPVVARTDAGTSRSAFEGSPKAEEFSMARYTQYIKDLKDCRKAVNKRRREFSQTKTASRGADATLQCIRRQEICDVKFCKYLESTFSSERGLNANTFLFARVGAEDTEGEVAEESDV